MTTICSAPKNKCSYNKNSKDHGKYDFIFEDAFNDLSIPYHLTTREFAAQLKRLLKPEELFAPEAMESFKI